MRLAVRNCLAQLPASFESFSSTRSSLHDHATASSQHKSACNFRSKTSFLFRLFFFQTRSNEHLWSLCVDSTITGCVDYPDSLLGTFDSEKTYSSESQPKKRKWTRALPYPKRRLVTDEGSSEFNRDDSSALRTKTDLGRPLVTYKVGNLYIDKVLHCCKRFAQGTIITCINADAGIYELDSGIRSPRFIFYDRSLTTIISSLCMQTLCWSSFQCPLRERASRWSESTIE